MRGAASDPAWSPDGRWLASPDSRQVVFEVTHDRGRYTWRAYSLSVLDIGSGDIRKLTYGGSASDDPTRRDDIVGKSTW